MKNLKRVLYSEIHIVKLNGIAIAGWVTASLFGVASLIKEIVTTFT